MGARNGNGDVYAYDMAYRLVDARYDVTNPATEVQNPGSQAFVKLVQYTLDGLGNRSQVQTTPPTPPAQVTYATDVVNQYTSVGGTARTHDSNGNLSDDGTQLYEYDFQNRLVRVTNKATQTVVATYRYDAQGRRVERAVSGGATTRYILEGVQVVEEYDNQGVWQARYVYEDGIDQPRAMDRADQADVNGNQNTTEILRFHYHQQALGCVTEMTQPTGAVVEWVTYDVYGAATIRNQNGNVVGSSLIGNPYLYTGREFDAESGLYFYRARHYDPVTGRFLQRDPLGFVDGLNRYAYACSSPMTLRDPLGLDTNAGQGVGGAPPFWARVARDLVALEAEKRAKEIALQAAKDRIKGGSVPAKSPRYVPFPKPHLPGEPRNEVDPEAQAADEEARRLADDEEAGGELAKWVELKEKLEKQLEELEKERLQLLDLFWRSFWDWRRRKGLLFRDLFSADLVHLVEAMVAATPGSQYPRGLPRRRVPWPSFRCPW